MRNWKKFLRDEKGVTMIMVAIAIVMIFAFAVLAIDLSMIQLAKTQLQNAADASALAGALAAAKYNRNLDSARTEAIKVAGLNVAIQDIQRPVNIDASDITFPDSTHITVTTHRTKAKGDPITLYFMKVLGSENKGEMKARATAAIMGLSGTNCLKPFCPPDKWYDANGDGNWNPNQGDYYDPEGTGYVAPRDIGAQVILSRRNPNQDFGMSNYYTVDFPPKNTGNPISGANAVRDWITSCSDPSITVSIGDQLQIEPGAMTGPVNQGLNDLIAQDPGAYWDPVTKTVKNSAYPVSPRVIKAAAFDPRVGRADCGPGRKCVTVVKLIVVFVVGHSSDNITGRFMSMATDGVPCDTCPPNFLYTIALTE